MDASEGQRAAKRAYWAEEIDEEEALKRLRSAGLGAFCAESYLHWNDEDKVRR